MECEAVVYAPQGALVVLEAVAGFAVAVVDYQVEDGEFGEFVGVALDEVEVGGVGVAINVHLHRADAVGAFAEEGVGDVGPAERAAEDEGGALALVEGAAGVVVEWALAVAGLVDGADAVAIAGV